MPLDRDIDASVLSEELRIGLHRGLLIGTNVRLVVIEVDVFHILAKQVLIADRGSRRWRWLRRLRHRQAGGGLLRSTRTLRGVVIWGRIRRRNALRAVRLPRANAINRHC